MHVCFSPLKLGDEQVFDVEIKDEKLDQQKMRSIEERKSIGNEEEIYFFFHYYCYYYDFLSSAL